MPTRAAVNFSLLEHPQRWVITQQLVDPDGDGGWRFVATVDLAAALDEGAPALVLEQLGAYDPDEPESSTDEATDGDGPE